MEGAALAAKRRYDLAVIQAWHTEAFARTKRLKKASAYLADRDNRASSSSGELMAFMRSLKKQGVKMDIKKLN